MSAIQAEIEARLSDAEPKVEVLLAEVVGGGLVRLFIDHPDGVTLDLCERVSHALNDLREHYALFCLGRALMQLGRASEARRPLAQAASLRPDRRDYRIYRDRARAAAA